MTNAGYYSLQASNSLGVANSTWAQVTVHVGVNQISIPTNATTIYNDSFTHTAANLAFTSPDVTDTTGEQWYGLNGSFVLDGDQLNLANLSPGTLAITPVANHVYIVSGLLLPACGDSTSSGLLGFNVNVHNFPVNSGWVAFAGANGDGTGSTYAGSSAASTSGTANAIGGPATYYVQLTVNADGSGTVVYTKNTEAYATNALTAAQVTSITSVAVAGANSAAVDNFKLTTYSAALPTVSLTTSGSSLQLTYAGGTLLQATNLLGPWTTNTGASPVTIFPTNGPQMFYRVRQ
jgi:hypothetical protein